MERPSSITAGIKQSNFSKNHQQIYSKMIEPNLPAVLPQIFIIGVIGKHNSGKTTLARRLFQEFQKKELPTLALWQEAVLKDKKKIGYIAKLLFFDPQLPAVLPLSRWLAIRKKDLFQPGNRSGEFRFRKDIFLWTEKKWFHHLEKLSRRSGSTAGKYRRTIYIVDELGIMESEGKGHLSWLPSALGKIQGILILCIRAELEQAILEKLSRCGHSAEKPDLRINLDQHSASIALEKIVRVVNTFHFKVEN